MKNFNKDWKFALTEEISGHLHDFNDEGFRTIELPHDFSIEQPYNQEIGDGCTGYLVGGIGWYRKKMTFDEDIQRKKVFLVFDGIYNRSNIYFNEAFIKFHPYGYSPFILDVTNQVTNGENTLAIKVDRTRYADSRWYTGSGIYRKAKLYIFDKTYIPVWGVRIKTPVVSSENAEVEIHTQIKNETKEIEVMVVTQVFTPEGQLIDTLTDEQMVKDEGTIVQKLQIRNPILWDIYKGNQYKVITKLEVQGKVLQVEERKFGIREFFFDVNEGFFINGRNELIKGVCLHHDAGLVGAAVPKDVWRRRLETLVEAGVNAIRTAHNPASEEFIELCDEMGLLVQEEFYDEWDNPKDKRYNMADRRVDYITRGHDAFFKDYAKEDLQAVIQRDINKPSIIQWSIGNEIEWTYPKYNTATGYFGANANGNYFWSPPPYDVETIRENVKKLPKEQYEVGDTAKKLAQWTKELDDTRPVIANCILPSASYESGYTDALDIVGFSYRQIVYDRCHEHYPDKPIMGTENLGQWHEWKQVLDKKYLSGIFLWTGIDYVGESGNVDVWPRKATRSGLLDVAGFKKPSYYMFKALWSNKPSIYMATQTLEKSLYTYENGKLKDKAGSEWQKRLWAWQDVNEHYNYEVGENIVVECYSNCSEVTLYINERATQTLKLEDFEDHIYKWCVPYEPGTIKVIGGEGENQVICTLTTAGVPESALLTVDREVLELESEQVCHLTAELIDGEGNFVRHQEAELTFEIKQPIGIYGVDNGSVDFVGDHFSDTILTNKGKALMVFRGKEKGKIEICVKIGEKIVNTLTVSVE